MASDSLDYIFDPIETDPDVLAQEAFDYITARWPGWVANDSNLEARVISACARMVAEACDVASQVPASIFKYFGQAILGVAPVNATPALVDSTWTFLTNPSGRTIEAGTWVAIPDADSVARAFEVVDDVTIASPTLTTAVGQVHLRSLEEGADLTALGGAGFRVYPIDAISWVDQIHLTGPTDGGVDEETPDAYLDRLSRRLTLMAPRPILAPDYALLAQDTAERNGATVTAMAIDNYDPATDTYNNERMVAVFVRDAVTGLAVPSGIKDAIDFQLQSQREVNFIVTVGDPSGPTTVDITYSGVVTPGSDPTSVRNDANASLSAFFASSAWGFDPGESRRWRNMKVVRLQDVSAVLNNVIGFDYWTSLTIGLNGGAQTAADHNLTGVAPITAPGTMAGTMIAP